MNPSFAAGKAGGTPNQLGAASAPGSATVLEPGTPAFEGAQIIATKPCVGCHTIPGIPGATGTVGPNLSGVASRAKIAGGAVNNSGPEDLKKWILNPAALKPGTLMPNVGLSDDEATKITAFLETLK
jgi:cytochrome c1